MMGIGEMAVIAGIALVVIGPEKFPDFAKVVLKTIRDLRGYVEDVKHEMAEELKPIKREMDQISRYDAERYIDALTGPDKDASGPKDHVEGTVESSTDDPYAFNHDYGQEYQDYNPEVPGGTVAESDENPTDGVDQQPGEAQAEAGETEDRDDEFDAPPPPERLD